ncbi:nicotinate phosphoribosyltransferase [Pasteurella multocida]|uniref:nicotinate phosphoribosyltransferase n=1 Tax=Pasteurella multocida TaxID=747 RepID=UPI00099BF1D3|nr:nicotinate phosphoribosyltransferase [Pasteurella multocida]MCL7766018.1 nicotinate phosphoribosyltransferase [Pasteurella multocida]MCL7824343.1 nicotinate phosphoribosyltransferase [Pasteurella multocida]MCL7827960.1 nicotinate phosphoribosyltransferase [Pasteurella multocida]MCL7833159.1 nicotinate phosphoribosyltransferase [Pasteurella multocida]OPC86767.1 nicotinate phosphoribosyltransferase [Pasteurella multocida subsp. multocida]
MYTSNFLNLILNTDSYKASHWLQYPPNTEYISYYIEARGGNFDVLAFGLQAFIKEYLLKPISQNDIDEAEVVLTAHGLPFNRQGWQRLLEKHQGLLPIKIEAVPEGTVLPTGNVVCQIVNTDPEFFWLVGYLETALLRAIWYPSTVASVSYFCKQKIKTALEKSSDNLAGLGFKLHDFGARGASSLETVALGGLAHLVNFMGTDSVSALVAAKRWYNATSMPAFSIPAAEHSTMTSWGKEREVDAYRNMVEQFAGEHKIYAVVSDSYDLWNALENIWGTQLKDLVEIKGGTLVVRPDSGDPAEVVCRSLAILAEKFGTTLNSKGYKVLPDCVRLIQGDGINVNSLGKILEAILASGFSVENVAFGMGGGLLQQVNRDTMSWAMKASAVCIAGEWHDVYKDPITSQAKRSKRGALALVKQENQWHTIEQKALGQQKNQLRTVFLNGELLIDEHFDDIRRRAGF